MLINKTNLSPYFNGMQSKPNNILNPILHKTTKKLKRRPNPTLNYLNWMFSTLLFFYRQKARYINKKRSTQEATTSIRGCFIHYPITSKWRDAWEHKPLLNRHMKAHAHTHRVPHHLINSTLWILKLKSHIISNTNVIDTLWYNWHEPISFTIRLS